MADRLNARIFVRGASTVGWSGRMGGARHELTFPRVVERELIRGGRPTVVEAATRAGMPTSAVVRNWEHDVLGFSPDVVVYTVGHYETIHALWPNRVERYANSLTWPARSRHFAYRKRVVRPLWRLMVKLQTIIDRKLPSRFTVRAVHGAAADLRRAIELIAQVQSPRVVLMEAPLPGTHALHLFPGMEPRVALFNRLLHVIADESGPAVEVFATNALLGLDELAVRDEILPDGFHFSAEAHDAVGRALAGQIAPWLDRQPHLQTLDRD